MSADQLKGSAAQNPAIPPLTFERAIDRAAGYLDLALEQQDLARMAEVRAVAEGFSFLARVLSDHQHDHSSVE